MHQSPVILALPPQSFSAPNPTQGLFEDELGRGGAGAGGSRLEAHLGDLAARHPDIADHLLDLLPNERKTKTATRGPTGFGSHKKSGRNSNMMEAGGEPTTVTTGTQTPGGGGVGGGGGLESDVKLRSTVPDMQTQASGGADSGLEGDRGQRSQSAPPQAPATGGQQNQHQQTSPQPTVNQHTNTNQQGEEGIRLIPIRTETPSSQGHRPTGQPMGFPPRPSPGAHHFGSEQPHVPPPRQEERQPTVRHIPIFVEGRDEPLLPREVPSAGSKRGGCQGKPEHEPQHYQQQKKQPPQQPHPQQQYQQPHAQPQPQQRPPPQPHQQHQQQQTSAPPHHSPTPPPQQPPQKPDPLQQVADVVKEVEALSAKVKEWNGTSRTDKEYMYLDEMLTRELLKLDNIETEGRDEVRTARKDAIRRIQDAISVLEAKADQNAQQDQTMSEKTGEPEKMDDSSDQQTQTPAQNQAPEPMDSAPNNTSTQT